MGSPVINSENVWNIYRELLYRFGYLDNAEFFLEECQVYLNVLDDQVTVLLRPSVHKIVIFFTPRWPNFFLLI